MNMSSNIHIFFLCLCIFGLKLKLVSSNEGLDWNEVVINAEVENAAAFPVGLQFHPLAHTAAYESLRLLGCHSSSSRCTTNAQRLTIAYAYCYVLNTVLPKQHLKWVSLMKQYYEMENDTVVRETAKQTGETAAKKVIDERMTSGLGEFDYMTMPDPASAPTAYPLEPCFLNTITGIGNVLHYAQWGSIDGYILPSMSYIGSDPPPLVNSTTFMTDYNRTFVYGRRDSTVRTEQDTINAIFHDAGVGTEGALGTWTRLLGEFVKANNTGVYDTVVMMKILSQAVHDDFGGIIREKNVWLTGRPCHLCVDGIPSVPSLPSDPEWQPLVLNPAGGEYPGGHASGAAVTYMLVNLWFDFDMEFTLITNTTNYAVAGNPPIPPQTFANLTDFLNKALDARSAAGLHFDFANEAGKLYGFELGLYAWERECKDNKCLIGR